MAITGAVAEKTDFSSSFFLGSRKTQNGAAKPPCLIAMETQVVSKATSHAALPVALLGCSHRGVQASEKGSLSGSLWPLKRIPHQREVLRPEVGGETPPTGLQSCPHETVRKKQQA